MQYRLAITVTALLTVLNALSGPAQAQDAYRPLKQQRLVYFADAGERRAVAVITRGDLQTSNPGPLLIEEFDTTTFVPPGASAMLDRDGQIRIDLPVA